MSGEEEEEEEKKGPEKSRGTFFPLSFGFDNNCANSCPGCEFFFNCHREVAIDYTTRRTTKTVNAALIGAPIPTTKKVLLQMENGKWECKRTMAKVDKGGR